ncbi:MAG: hypothetical protein MUP98_14020 [Candidatus Aminicenantes bacterium]|nr:hypothetical protein [Candidatus Aminicenantes bacterium]
MFTSLFVSLVIYSAFVSSVLALIRRNEKKKQIRYGLSLFLIMVVGSLAFGWFMYLFV